MDIKSPCHSWLIKGQNVIRNTLAINILFLLHVAWLISLMFWWTLITLQSRLMFEPLDTAATRRKRSNKVVIIDFKFIPANADIFFSFYAVVLSPAICSSHPSRISSLSYNVSLYFWNCVLDFSSAFYGFFLYDMILLKGKMSRWIFTALLTPSSVEPYCVSESVCVEKTENSM